MKTSTLDEEVYLFAIITTLIQISQQRFLLCIHLGCIAKIIEKEQLSAEVSLKELHLAKDSFLWLINYRGILLFQASILRTLWLPILGIHVYHTEYMVITKRNAFLNFVLQLLQAGMLGIVGLDGQAFQLIA